MSTGALATSPAADLSQERSPNVVRDFCAQIDHFLEWQMANIRKVQPSGQVLEEHRQSLKWMLRSARLILSLVRDPDYADQGAVDLLSLKLHQLEESWKGICEAMPEAQANKLLQTIFPA
jgi:hypothetical protein